MIYEYGIDVYMEESWFHFTIISFNVSQEFLHTLDGNFGYYKTLEKNKYTYVCIYIIYNT